MCSPRGSAGNLPAKSRHQKFPDSRSRGRRDCRVRLNTTLIRDSQDNAELTGCQLARTSTSTGPHTPVGFRDVVAAIPRICSSKTRRAAPSTGPRLGRRDRFTTARGTGCLPRCCRRHGRRRRRTHGHERRRARARDLRARGLPICCRSHRRVMIAMTLVCSRSPPNHCYHQFRKPGCLVRTTSSGKAFKAVGRFWGFRPRPVALRWVSIIGLDK